MTELKPCPFCGGTVRVNLVTDETYIRYYIHCIKCSARVEYSLTKSFNEDKAIEAWNRRTDVKKCRMIPQSPDCRGYTDGFICTNCQSYIDLGFICKEYSGNFCLECGAEVEEE